MAQNFVSATEGLYHELAQDGDAKNYTKILAPAATKSEFLRCSFR